ncbi:MAG: sigma-70 family RNA polymerase sigma factor [Deltaproteobacteria bacterium]|nr:sigma-70 family RNA polymerase sigma factor [Deltaproteobacteria bacterium]
MTRGADTPTALAPAETLRLGRALVSEVSARLARQLGGVIPVSDLESAGNEALVTLLRAHDPAGAPLEAYLRRFLRWAMLDAARSHRREVPLGSRARALGACLWLAAAADDPEAIAPPADEHAALRSALGTRALATVLSGVGGGLSEVAADSTDRPDRALVREREHAALRRALGALEDEGMRDVLVRHYFGDEPFDSIASARGMSPTQICRLHRRALELLDRSLRTET